MVAVPKSPLGVVLSPVPVSLPLSGLLILGKFLILTLTPLYSCTCLSVQGPEKPAVLGTCHLFPGSVLPSWQSH